MQTIKTDRLNIYPESREQMEQFIRSQKEEILLQAYTQMLEGALNHPDEWEWYALWMVERSDGTPVGNLCFKGIGEDGTAEIGYGINGEYQGKGFATEAVKVVAQWAMTHPKIRAVTAEAEEDNAASIRVLEKSGFRRTGEIGEEGPCFEYRR